jgi:hypothetical protein
MKKDTRNPFLRTFIVKNMCVLDVFVRLRFDLIQTGNQLLVTCFDALEPVRRKSLIGRPRGNQTIDAINGVLGRRVDREIGKGR